MKKTEHTPGPWKASSDAEIFTMLDDDTRFTLAKCDFSHIRKAFAIKPNTEEEIEAKKRGYSFGYNVEQANAKLIAAAPDMLNALIKIKDYVSRELTVCHQAKQTEIDFILRHVNEAIKKATE